MDINFQPFKEPRGFIRLLQWLFAICAFATTVDYSGKYGFQIQCSNSNQTGGTATAVAEYPFNMDRGLFVIKNLDPKCPPPTTIPQPIGNAQSEAVFFVFTGVISFIYATVMIGVYLLADKIYLENSRAPLVDFFVTVMLAVFWIAGSSAWAHGISNVSRSMNTNDWFKCPQAYDCTHFFYDPTSKLVISVLFGFINFVLWCGNIWFLYKETAALLNGVMGGPQSNMQQTGTSP